MTSIRKAKKLGTYIPKKIKVKQRELYKDTLELASKVNRRLKGLKNAGYRGTWASKKLINRVDTTVLKGWTTSQGGKVKVQKGLTQTNYLNLQKAMRQFLNSITSKAKGIEETKRKTIETLRATLSADEKSKLNAEDAELYYDMLGDKDFDYFNTEKIGASTMWGLIEDANEAADTRDKWLQRLKNHGIKSNDKDIRTRALRLYEKYIA